jgi:hypothetical protein
LITRSPDGSAAQIEAPYAAEVRIGGTVPGLVEFLTDAEGDGVLVFEVDPAQVADDLVLATGDLEKITERARMTLEEALAKLKPPLQKVVDLFKDLSPDETVIEFGLKVGGETGLIIAKGNAEVNILVRMSWRPE